MLTLTSLLDDAGLPFDDIIVARHTPKEPPLRRVIRSVAVQRPDLFRAYQSVQGEKLESAMTRAAYMASFLDNGSGSAIFAGLYWIGQGRRVTQTEFNALPENQELFALGMDDEWTRDPLMFEMRLDDELSEWIGRLCIGWSANPRPWWQWAKRERFPVTALHAGNMLSPAMPPWEEIVLSWGELQVLPPSWRAKLSEWRGVYLIFDVARERGYVGAAYGQDNILGRWRGYAASGHGGNVQLRLSKPVDLRFSILQRTSPDMPTDEVQALEGRWKNRLHTRSHGLNSN